MGWRNYAILFVVGLIVPLAISRYQSLPGYMDADYYFAGGIQLANGKGFTEPYLWNYLDDPSGLPHPSHAYWMPLASIISALGMLITGQTTYEAGRAPFILLSACAPLMTAMLAYEVTRKKLLAMVSGFLSIFSLAYLPYMPVPDNFAVFMLLGGIFLFLAPREEKWIPFALGIIAGCMTFARSDGLLWFALAGLTVLWKSAKKETSLSYVEQEESHRKGHEGGNGANFFDAFPFVFKKIFPAALLALIGYLAVMGPWHLRNFNLFGSIMAPGSGHLLWIRSYDETFIYPASILTSERFLQTGWDIILRDRAQAFIAILLENVIAAQGGVFLLPFIAIGLWNLRNDFRTKLSITGWLILLATMTLAFPFAGSRGGFLHAGAAFQIFFWVAAPIGVDAVVSRGLQRGILWDKNAPVMFQIILVIIAIIASAFYAFDQVVVNEWATDDVIYASVEKAFQENGISPQDVVIVRNPPGYFIRSGRSAVALPFGDRETILQIATRYNARYLVLEMEGTTEDTGILYSDPNSSPSFVFLGEAEGAKLFRIEWTR